MTRWRQRIGEKGVEKLLQITIEAGKATKTITERSLEKVIVDTIVQPKTVQHPTDARLYRKVHAAMLRIAEAEGLELRQSYRKLMARAFQKHGGYAKAKQFKRARKILKSLKTMTGRVVRDGGSASAGATSRRTHRVRYVESASCPMRPSKSTRGRFSSRS